MTESQFQENVFAVNFNYVLSAKLEGASSSKGDVLASLLWSFYVIHLYIYIHTVIDVYTHTNSHIQTHTSWIQTEAAFYAFRTQVHDLEQKAISSISVRVRPCFHLLFCDK